MRKSRLVYASLSLVTVALGLASRRYHAVLPGWVGAYAGDVLWALLVFWLVRFGWPRWGRRRAAALAVGFAFFIEGSQLYQVPWLNALRATTPGSLVLGHGFLWSDLLCYLLGVWMGVGVERFWPCIRSQASHLSPAPVADGITQNNRKLIQ